MNKEQAEVSKAQSLLVIPSNIQDKSLSLQAVFSKAAKAALAKGVTKDEATFAGINAVKIEENRLKRIAESQRVVKPKAATRAFAGDSSGSAFAMTSKALHDIPSEVPTEEELQQLHQELKAKFTKIIKSEFDPQGRLILTYSDGTKVISQNVAPADSISQSVTLHTNPVFDYVLFNTTAGLTSEDFLPGMLTWNEFEDCLNIVQNDGSMLQVGLENYIEVVNRSGSTIQNGTIVRFSGVNGEEIPQVLPMIGDGSVEPLFVVGVLTNTLTDGERGRATILGKVRTLNTTGSDVGETWQQGDLLWVSPTNPGKLTKVRPTAPNVQISIAAVLKVGTSDGILLVRPTIFPRLFYGKFMSTQSQLPALANTAYAITFNSTDIASGVVLENNSRIKVLNAGLYSFDFRLQITSTNANQKNIWIWARKNGIDVPNSATKVSVTGNVVELVPSWDFVYSFVIGDYFELMYAVDDTGLLINAPAATAFAPATPSAVLKVKQVNL